MARHMLRTGSLPLVFLSLLFLAGAIVMLVFCLLAGVTHHNPLNRAWFLQADTSNIPGASPLSHFTMYNVCDSNNGRNVNCSGRSAAFPMLPQRYFNTRTGVPSDFFNRWRTYYYLSRFTYAFYIITIFWAFLALVVNLLALCSTVATGLTAFVTLLAWFSAATLASIMTACYVMAQNAFRNAGRFARVGVTVFAWTWTSFALISLSLLFLLWTYLYRRRSAHRETRRTKRDVMLGGLLRRRKHGYDADYESKRVSYDSGYYNNGDRTHETTARRPRGDFTAGDYPVPPTTAGARDGTRAHEGTRPFPRSAEGEYTVPGGRTAMKPVRGGGVGT